MISWKPSRAYLWKNLWICFWGNYVEIFLKQRILGEIRGGYFWKNPEENFRKKSNAFHERCSKGIHVKFWKESKESFCINFWTISKKVWRKFLKKLRFILRCSLRNFPRNSQRNLQRDSWQNFWRIPWEILWRNCWWNFLRNTERIYRNWWSHFWSYTEMAV